MGGNDWVQLVLLHYDFFAANDVYAVGESLSGLIGSDIATQELTLGIVDINRMVTLVNSDVLNSRSA